MADFIEEGTTEQNRWHCDPGGGFVSVGSGGWAFAACPHRYKVMINRLGRAPDRHVCKLHARAVGVKKQPSLLRRFIHGLTNYIAALFLRDCRGESSLAVTAWVLLIGCNYGPSLARAPAGPELLYSLLTCFGVWSRKLVPWTCLLMTQDQ